MAPVCLVCESAAARRLYRLPRFDVLMCARCDLVYLHPLPSDDEIRALFTALYTTDEGGLPELRGYYAHCFEDRADNPLVQAYERWLDVLERHRAPGRLLDVGCGTGLFLAVARRRGWTATGIDDCVEATRHAVEHFHCDVRTGDFADVASAGHYDAITMWDTLEHARRPVEVLATVRRCLAPGGLVAIATPNQRSLLERAAAAVYHASAGRVTGPLERAYPLQHFLYFTPSTLEKTLARADLEVAYLALEETDLRRLTLSPSLRLGLRALFWVADRTNLSNRLFALVRARGSD
jgi:2-polyprenyl-3-methyl-5-hydroxy-6-metoxy-1,4-benzoquinol methylase